MNRTLIPFIALGAALSISIWCVRFALFPATADFARHRFELSAYRLLTSESGGYANLRGKVAAEHDSLTRIAAVQTAGQGDATDISGLLRMLIGKAGEADIRFVKIEPQQQSVEQDLVRYPVVLEMNTSYHALGRLVASFENMPNVLRIERLAVSSQRGPTISVKLLITCFLQRNG